MEFTFFSRTSDRMNSKFRTLFPPYSLDVRSSRFMAMGCSNSKCSLYVSRLPKGVGASMRAIRDSERLITFVGSWATILVGKRADVFIDGIVKLDICSSSFCVYVDRIVFPF